MAAEKKNVLRLLHRRGGGLAGFSPFKFAKDSNNVERHFDFTRRAIFFHVENDDVGSVICFFHFSSFRSFSLLA